MPSGGGGGTQTVTSEVPEPYRTFANENLTLAGTMANQPYVQYGGQRIAGWTDNQQKGFAAVPGAVNAWQPMMEQSNQALGGLADGSADVTARQGSEFMSDYFNPYESQVVDNVVNDMTRAHSIGLGALSGRAAGSGAYGSSRHGVAEAEMGRNLLDRVGNAAGQLRHQGFTTAAGFGSQDAGRHLQADQGNQQTKLAAAQAMAQNAAMAQNLGLTGAQALLNVGGMQQGLDQQNLDLAYQDFIDQQNHPLRMMAIRQSALGQTPMGSVQRMPTGGANIGGLLSGAGSLLGGVAALCWVAREVYGADNPKWLRFRDILLDKADDDLLTLYAVHGEGYAAHLRENPEERAEVKGYLDMVLEAA